MALLLFPSGHQILHALANVGWRMLTCLRSFLFLLTHDTGGDAGRAWAPWILVGWVVVTVLAAPASLALLRLMGTSHDLRRTSLLNLGLVATQLSFFAVDWYVIGWGHRLTDWAVFAASIVPCWLIAKLGFEVSFGQALLYTLLEPLAPLAIAFLAVFAATETGRLTL